MSGFGEVLWMEILKVRRTKVFPVTLFFFAFIGIMMALLMYVAQHPEIANRSATISAKTSFLPGSDWSAFFELMIQLNLTLGVIGSGIITSWCFGREFSDRVVKDLLALPVSRASIIVSKLIVVSVWGMLLSIVALVLAILTGLMVHIPGWEEVSLSSFLPTYFICAFLNILLVTPVAFIASVGRGYILPIGFVILILIMTQLLFLGLPGLSFYMPWALPALFSRVAGEAVPPPGVISYIIYFITVSLGLIGTVGWWRYADHK